MNSQENKHMKIAPTITKGTPIFHIEYGKGFILDITDKKNDALIMCFFPRKKKTDWCLKSSLLTDTDDLMSLRQMDKAPKNDAIGDQLQQALESLFGGKNHS
jgi:hypothetical protein